MTIPKNNYIQNSHTIAFKLSENYIIKVGKHVVIIDNKKTTFYHLMLSRFYKNEHNLGDTKVTAISAIIECFLKN